MTVDWSQFHDGDEVAITLVARVSRDPSENMPRLYLGPGVTDYWYPDASSFRCAVDAYRIGPEVVPGALYQDATGIVYVVPESHPDCLAIPGNEMQHFTVESLRGLRRVKVVPYEDKS